MSEKERFCKGVKAQINDENMAVAEYNAKAAEVRKLNEPAGEVIAILFEKLGCDEASHADALTKMFINVCPLQISELYKREK